MLDTNREERDSLLSNLVSEVNKDTDSMDTGIPGHAWHCRATICYWAEMPNSAAMVKWLLEMELTQLPGTHRAVSMLRVWPGLKCTGRTWKCYGNGRSHMSSADKGCRMLACRTGMLDFSR